jgi:hypothetical protein
MSRSTDPADREARAAANQAFFREFDNRVDGLNRRMDFVVPVGQWFCECANDICLERIQMSAHEYELVRLHGSCFFVAPSDEHFRPDAERVIEHHERYWVVERAGVAVSKDGAAPLPLHT